MAVFEQLSSRTDEKRWFYCLDDVIQFQNGLVFVCVAFLLFIQTTRWTILEKRRMSTRMKRFTRPHFHNKAFGIDEEDFLSSLFSRYSFTFQGDDQQI